MQNQTSSIGHQGAQQRHLDKLVIHNVVHPCDADDASKVLGFYPSRMTWLEFFDKALLIVGSVCLLLALVFFIAYNWFYMGKMGKFALVEGGLVVSIVGYAILAYQQKFRLAQQLLLLIASVITGSLLALFGQVYQTGADTWQLFFNWALLIIPFVLLARLPALWLLWLGLINACLMQYTKTVDWSWIAPALNIIFANPVYYVLAFMVNFVALNLWLRFVEKEPIITFRSWHTLSDNKPALQRLATAKPSHQVAYHWSTYVVGLVLTYYATRLAVSNIMDFGYFYMIDVSVMAFALWLCWVLFMYWRHRYRRVDLLMLTYLCTSVIVVTVLRTLDIVRLNEGAFLLIAFLIIAMSTGAVVWLRKIAKQVKDAQHTPPRYSKDIARTTEVTHDAQQ